VAPDAAHGIKITLDILLSKGPFEGVFNQFQFPDQVYQQMAIVATRTSRELPAKGDKSQEISKILQGPKRVTKSQWVPAELQHWTCLLKLPGPGQA
jgi:hypothetical protein